MSHIVTIKTKLHDQTAIQNACQRLNLSPPTQGTAEIFSGEVTGLIVNLPDWQYPVVIDTDSGEVQYDNYDGAWGEQSELDKFLQAYAVEKARLEAKKQNLSVTEQQLQDGSIRLQITEN